MLYPDELLAVTRVDFTQVCCAEALKTVPTQAGYGFMPVVAKNKKG